MTASRLTIRYGERAVRETSAWFAPGPGPNDWLHTIYDWNVPLETLLFFVVPGAGRSAPPLGALVLSFGKSIAAPGSAHPYGQLAKRLYLPVEARLDPPVSEDELAALLPTGVAVCVWHPVAGLIGFEADEGCPFSRFLEFAPPEEADWNVAQPGIAINERLRSVQPESVPSAIEVLQRARDDIASQSESLSELPPLPDEPGSDPLSRAGAGMSAFFAKIGIWLLNLLPHSASSPTWADRLEETLKQKLQKAMERMNLSSARERELRRLLSMLENDPDQGLKFAIPFSGDGSHRGLGEQGSQLTRRDIDFNLGRLGGGGPADPWDVSNEMRLALSQKYRLLATRELQLKRYRRAAYIFAELVGDLLAAAGVLMTGRHYPEAAALYRDKLKRPLEAARCLEKGGLWAEALELYKEVRQYESAGDMARKLEQEDEASRLYRTAVVAARGRADMLEAARLLEQKLRVPLEALDELEEGWGSGAGGECIRETFRLAGRLSLHEKAAELLSALAADSRTIPGRDICTEQLVQIARTYPESSIRLAAADAARVVMAKVLADERRSGAADAGAWIQNCLRDLAPEDRLIVRDGQRYFDDRARAAKAARGPQRTVPRSSRRYQIRLTRELKLPLGTDVVVAASNSESLFVAGYDQRSFLLLRHDWLSPVVGTQMASWPITPGFTQRPMIIPDPRGDRVNIIQLLVEGRFDECILVPPRDSERSVVAAGPPWDQLMIVGVAAGDSAQFVLRHEGDQISLTSYNWDNELLATRSLDRSPEAGYSDLPVPMQAHGKNVYIGLEDRLMIVRGNGATEEVEMLSEIRGLACSRPHTRTRVAVTFDVSGIVVWDDFSGIHQEPFGQSMNFPVAGFTNGGLLVAAGDDRCRLYSTSDGHVCFEAEAEWPIGKPVAVHETGGANEFAVCFADGRLRIYTVDALPGR